jgi:hypothetical protein
MSRIYGKPTETVVQQIPPDPTRSVIASLSLDEKIELLQQLRTGGLAGTAPALAIVEPIPPTA